MTQKYGPHIKRLLITFLIAILFVGGINEGAHLIQKEKTDRPPETVELIIPAGTAKLVAMGESEPSIPSELTFVIGDTLLVKNEDEIPHELGPLFVPAGSSASLKMEDANKYTLGCTFQPSRYLDFNVRSRTTTLSKLQALGLAAPPMGVFLFIYSLLVFPIDPKRAEKENVHDIVYS
jgi:hypothetical protein